MGLIVLEFLVGMVRLGKGVDWEFMDDSNSGYLMVELVGPILDWDCQGLMCIGVQYFLGFVSGSGLADYKLDGLFCLDGMVIFQVGLEF